MRIVLAVIVAATAACQFTAARSIPISDGVSLVFKTPLDGGVVVLNSQGKVDVVVAASGSAGVGAVAILVQGWDKLANAAMAPVVIANCEAHGSPNLECTASFSLADFPPDPAGRLTLLAETSNSLGSPSVKQIQVHVGSGQITIVSPPLTAGQNPPAAIVKGAVVLAVKVTDASPVTKVDFLLDDKFFLSVTTASGDTFSSAPVSLGVSGSHKLSALATDQDQQQSAASEIVLVTCGSDGDCGLNQRCTSDGACETVTITQSDCDDAHPCAASDVCLASTCGGTRKCRSGCNPNTANGCGASAYCEDILPSLKTSANKGGACIPGDSCDPFAQDCPNLPLDRSQPAGATNPAVPANCMVEDVGVNACVAAGTLKQGDVCDTNKCASSAGQLSQKCAKGLLCVQAANPNTHQVIDQPRCQPFCHYDSKGGANQIGGCPSGLTCAPLLGAGGAPLSAGACTPPPPIDPGVTCQSCFLPTNCGTRNGCVQDAFGQAFCGQACKSAADCGSGNDCFTFGSATQTVNLCYPKTASCQNILCQPCDFNDQSSCGQDFCLQQKSDGKSYCGINCATDSDCPSNFVCFTVGNASDGAPLRQCYPGNEDCGAPGPAADGGVADGGLSDAGTNDGGGTDGGATDGGTSDGGVTDGGISDSGAADGGSHDGGITDGGASDAGFVPGWRLCEACVGDTDCGTNNVCVHPAGGGAAYCGQACNSAPGQSNCPYDYTCTSVKGGSGTFSWQCVPVGTRICPSPPTQCQACTSSADCGAGLDCIQFSSNGRPQGQEQPYCASTCPSVGTLGVCPPAYACMNASLVSGGTSAHCVVSSTGHTCPQIPQLCRACSHSSDCGADGACAKGIGGGSPFCVEPCGWDVKVSNGISLDCAPEFTCKAMVDLVDGTVQNFCVPTPTVTGYCR